MNSIFKKILKFNKDKPYDYIQMRKTYKLKKIHYATRKPLKFLISTHYPPRKIRALIRRAKYADRSLNDCNIKLIRFSERPIKLIPSTTVSNPPSDIREGSECPPLPRPAPSSAIFSSFR